MLKATIALINSDPEAVSLYKSTFREKYNIFEFTNTDTYIELIEREKRNPFELLIISHESGGLKTPLEMIKWSKKRNLGCAFIFTAENLKKEELLILHNHEALKIFESPLNFDLIHKTVQDFLYRQHLQNVVTDTEMVCLKITQHTDFIINVLNEYVPNKELNQLYNEQFPNEGIAVDFKSHLQSLEEHLYTNIKMRDILLKQNNLDIIQYENSLL